MCVYCRLNENKDSKYIIRKDGKYAMTEDGKKVPKICPECGAEMTLQIKGEPIYICKNDHYFGTMKFQLKEGFEFNSVNKNKDTLFDNVFEMKGNQEDEMFNMLSRKEEKKMSKASFFADFGMGAESSNKTTVKTSNKKVTNEY